MSQYTKAIVSFIVTYLASLTTAVQAGASLTSLSTWVSSLIAALIGGLAVYRFPNSYPTTTTPPASTATPSNTNQVPPSQ